MHGVQIPLDAADGQPPLFPQRGDQAEQVDAAALLAQDHAVQFRRRCAAPSAGRASPSRASPSNVDVLGDLHRNHRQVIGQEFETSRVRWVQPPDRWAPQSGQFSITCSTRWVGVMRRRAKPWRRCLRGPSCAGGFRADCALRPGIRGGSPGFAWPSSSAIRRCNRSITACNSAMMAISTSRSTVVRSTSVSMPCISHNHRHPCQRSATRLRSIHLTKSELYVPRHIME